MKYENINGSHWIILSRRNLRSLLAKLDGHPPDSACTIQGGVEAWGYFVKAEEDEAHYASRAEWPQETKWGPMHPTTEEVLRREQPPISDPSDQPTSSP